MPNRKLYGGIEAGGTKFVCGVGSGGGELLSRIEISTSDPNHTLGLVVDFFKSHTELCSVGIGSFGPVDLNKSSSNYGAILNTPKPGWSGINILNIISSSLNIPVKIATDTDVAAVGEYYYGIGLKIDNFVYLTIGTGIGGSIMANGQIVYGASHPEMGHIRIPVNSQLNGTCPFHNDCLEGLASGKSLEALTGLKASLITDEHIWQQEAHYIANGLINIIMITQPQRIILGGSVIKHKGLLQQIQANVYELSNNYLPLPNMQSYIVQASSESIGVLGAIKLATL